MQDVRASFISTLNGLSVSGVTLNAAYYSDLSSTVLPAVLVRELTSEVSGAIGGGTEVFDAVYDLAIVCVDSPTVTAETFLPAAANAINTAIRSTWSNLGGAYGVRLINTRDVQAENVDGTLLYMRILSFRAHSAETY